MPSLNIGTIIRERRKELELSQEDLADGVCAVSTLSRIESGTQLPSKNHLEALLERLGYSITMVDGYMDGVTLRIHELKFKTQLNYINRNHENALRHLQELEQLVTDHTSLDWQFMLTYRVLLNQKNMSPQQRLEKLEEALAISCPRYINKELPRLLSYREILIFNNIAWALDDLGRRDEAIDILHNIRVYYERHVIVPEEALRTQPTILYNLSKLLGLAGRYDECIEVCNQGIRIARQTGRCTDLATTLYNQAWALLRRNLDNDRQIAQRSLRQACYQACAMEDQRAFLHFKKFYEETFGPLDL